MLIIWLLFVLSTLKPFCRVKGKERRLLLTSHQLQSLSEKSSTKPMGAKQFNDLLRSCDTV